MPSSTSSYTTTEDSTDESGFHSDEQYGGEYEKLVARLTALKANEQSLTQKRKKGPNAPPNTRRKNIKVRLDSCNHRRNFF